MDQHPGSALNGSVLAAALGPAPAGSRDAAHLRACLGRIPTAPCGPVRELGHAERDGVRIRSLAWDPGYGPSTAAWLLTPAAGEGPWPGVLALHDHGGFRWLGKEKIADGPDGPHPAVATTDCRDGYGGRGWANDLARAGCAVLVHDVLSWGSRRFAAGDLAAAEPHPRPLPRGDGDADRGRIDAYNALANQQEHTLAKQALLLGASLPGLIAHEDRIALDVLAARPECAAGPVACIGHSGGGVRAAVLAALDDRIGAAVVSGCLTTSIGLATHCTGLHTWQFIVPGWATGGGWCDILAVRAGMPLLVLHGARDGGYAADAVADAGVRLRAAWSAAGAPGRLRIVVGDHGHAFPPAAQRQAAAWLAAQRAP
ncbi:MAG: hypothetical protein RLZZ127_359 [Planctomycetota bacterium]|jgi:dienelactone hydrolase